MVRIYGLKVTQASKLCGYLSDLDSSSLVWEGPAPVLIKLSLCVCVCMGWCLMFLTSS